MMSTDTPSDILFEEQEEGSSEAGASSLPLTVQELVTDQRLIEDASELENDEMVVTRARLTIGQVDSGPSEESAEEMKYQNEKLLEPSTDGLPTSEGASYVGSSAANSSYIPSAVRPEDSGPSDGVSDQIGCKNEYFSEPSVHRLATFEEFSYVDPSAETKTSVPLALAPEEWAWNAQKRTPPESTEKDTAFSRPTGKETRPLGPSGDGTSSTGEAESAATTLQRHARDDTDPVQNTEEKTALLRLTEEGAHFRLEEKEATAHLRPPRDETAPLRLTEEETSLLRSTKKNGLLRPTELSGQHPNDYHETSNKLEHVNYVNFSQWATATSLLQIILCISYIYCFMNAIMSLTRPPREMLHVADEWNFMDVPALANLKPYVPFCTSADVECNIPVNNVRTQIITIDNFVVDHSNEADEPLPMFDGVEINQTEESGLPNLHRVEDVDRIDRNPYVPFSQPQEVEDNNPVVGSGEVDRPSYPNVHDLAVDEQPPNPIGLIEESPLPHLEMEVVDWTDRNPYVPFSQPRQVEDNNHVVGSGEVDQPSDPIVHGVGIDIIERNPYVPFARPVEAQDNDQVETGQTPGPIVHGVGVDPIERNPYVPFARPVEAQDNEQVDTGQQQVPIVHGVRVDPIERNPYVPFARPVEAEDDSVENNQPAPPNTGTG